MAAPGTPLTSTFTALLACAALGACTAADGDSESSDIEMHIDTELNQALAGLTDLDEIKMFLCRKGDLSAGIFSLRSFNGHLCEDKFVSGLKVVGGAALLICYDDNFENFQDSSCAENAFDDYGLSTYDQDAVTSQMHDIVQGYADASGASSSPFYSGVQTLFCIIPKTLLGPADAVHDIWCGA